MPKELEFTADDALGQWLSDLEEENDPRLEVGDGPDEEDQKDLLLGFITYKGLGNELYKYLRQV